jgi:uncharacterized RDD family membrane protein YckC
VYYREGLPWAPEKAEDTKATDGTDAKPADDAGQADATHLAGPAPSDWEETGVSNYDWRALEDGERVLLFHSQGTASGPGQQIEGLTRTGPKRWTRVVVFPQNAFTVKSGVCRMNEPETYAVVSQGIFGGLTLSESKNGTQGALHSYSGVSSFSNQMFPDMGRMMAIMNTASLATIVVFVLIVSVLMGAYRDPYFRWPAGCVRQAPLWRRGAALFVDWMIMALPGIAALPLIGWDFNLERLMSPPIVEILAGLMVAAVLWGLVMLFALSIMEGLWGFTPGKLLFRIRVVNTDLKPCGFARAVLRRVLLFVDTLFQCAVGLVLISLTPKQQRLGDLASGTVVLVREDIGERGA